ncbi:hypothetical protein [Pelosinus sp. sgz500959]|uniref:hypothetical protein n=1 Tax=Pelosinus sp. sgz500959 TaxID=3242472 RepID=UPI00366C2B3E
MKDIPVFVFHKGNPIYLKTVIKCATRFNNSVILAGDASNSTVCENWFNCEEYIPDLYSDFLDNFEQMSTYSYDFDTICFKRFFIMHEYMLRNQIDEIVFLDSDALLYVDVTEFFHRHECGAALSMTDYQDNFRWSYCAHCSYWKREALLNFLHFVIEVYRIKNQYYQQLVAKWDYHKKNRIKGGVCDMTLLYLWANQRNDVFNTCKVMEYSVFDNNIGSSNNYVFDEYEFSRILGIKKLKYNEGIPYLKLKTGELVKANVLHCSGMAKALINNIYKQNFAFAVKNRIVDVIIRVIRKVIVNRKKNFSRK